MTAYYQLCPKCYGDGHLGRFNSPILSTSTQPVCDVCNGAKTLFVNGSYEPTRGMIAAMAMQGLLATDNTGDGAPGLAVQMADALLEELNKPKE